MKNNINVLKLGKFKVLRFNSSPPRLEAKIILDRDNISQKLIFTLMEITHQYGFACSPPSFKNFDSPEMIFLVGTISTGFLSTKKILNRLYLCLEAIDNFLKSFNKQLDFTKVDISMFGGIDLSQFRPTEIAAVRDQHYNGSWRDFKKALTQSGRNEEAEVIDKCIIFEEENKKDLGLVGHKLGRTLYMIENQYQDDLGIN